MEPWLYLSNPAKLAERKPETTLYSDVRLPARPLHKVRDNPIASVNLDTCIPPVLGGLCNAHGVLGGLASHSLLSDVS